jgi:LPS-assembly protein
MIILAFVMLLQSELVGFSCTSKVESVDEVTRCTSGAVVSYGDMRVEADWIEFDKKSRQVKAGDRVKFTRPGEELIGGLLSINVETKAGTLTDVSGQVDGFFLKTREAERLPGGQWIGREGAGTACEGDCPNWGLTFKEATVDPGKKVSVKGSAFRVRGVPILWFPKLTIPSARRDRQSGFLMPGFGSSDTKGRSFRGSYFWAINRSYDATFTSEYFSKRGPTGTIDFRAAPNANTRIDVSEFFAIDRLGKGGHRTSITALSDLTRNWRGVANVDITSDFEFRQEFEEGFNVISSPIEQSMGFLTNNGSRSSLNVLYNRLAVFYPDQSVALRKFPSVDFELPTNSVGSRIPIYFNLNAGFTGMARRDSQINTPAFMQRIDIHPTLEIPVLRSSLLTWSHRLGVRDTLYTHSLDPAVVQRTLNRGVFDYTMSITGPQLERDFGTWKHVLEPTIEYRYVTGIDRLRQTIVVDETDLMANTSEIEYGVTSRFFSGHEFLTWRIAQKMYFDPTFGGGLSPGRRNTLEPLMDLTGFAFSDGKPRRFSPIVSIFRIATTPQTSTDIEVDYDTQREEFRSVGIMGSLNRSIVRSSVGYFFNKRTEIQSPNNQLRGLITIGDATRAGLSAGAGFSTGFSYEKQRWIFQGSTAQVHYNAECYGLRFEFSQVDLGARREIGWRAAITLKNLGTFGNLRPQERLF